MASSVPPERARAWWAAVDQANFDAAFRLMTRDAVIDWPLSNKRITSPDMWRMVNEHYPGRWAASVRSAVTENDTVVTITAISDGSITVEAMSFFTVHHGNDHAPRRILAGALRPARRLVAVDRPDQCQRS